MVEPVDVSDGTSRRQLLCDIKIIHVNLAHQYIVIYFISRCSIITLATRMKTDASFEEMKQHDQIHALKQTEKMKAEDMR